jgi:two-component system response regulator HydG
VLVTGASGTGKELAARALHELSDRSAGPFLVENCAALPETLIEAELFGHRKGAYTGADADRPGLFERASGGTLFLDEIGELPIGLQAKLLRVLESGDVRRVGDSVTRSTDVRIVTATNRDLATEVREGRFRADLLYRLDALRIEMPSLAAHVEDIPLLVDHFLRLEASKGGAPCTIAPKVMAALCARAWPGNVRELANEIARLCVLSPGEITDPALVRSPAEGMRAEQLGLPRTLAEIEREAIEAAIAAANGDKGKAADLLGISRAKVYARVKEWRDAERSDGDVTSS